MEYFKGYFAAPIGGEYKFMAIADNYLYLKISNITNNSNPANLKVLINANQYTTSHYNSYVRRFSTQT